MQAQVQQQAPPVSEPIYLEHTSSQELRENRKRFMTQTVEEVNFLESKKIDRNRTNERKY